MLGEMMRVISILTILFSIFCSPCYGEMYKWVDEKGGLHFTDDLSNIPERYRPEVERRKSSKEPSSPQPQEAIKPISLKEPVEVFEPEAITVDLVRRNELLFVEVILNGRISQPFIVDTGASFTLINRKIAKDLGMTMDETTPFIPILTVSSLIFAPMVTLPSIKVGKAEVENVDALIYDMPSQSPGLLGNSFLNKFRVVLDSLNGKMTLYPLQGTPSPDRPGGYGKDFWVGQFRFYHRIIEELKSIRKNYEGKGGSSSESIRVNQALRYFENQLNELDRKASLAGVPRNWRQ